MWLGGGGDGVWVCVCVCVCVVSNFDPNFEIWAIGGQIYPTPLRGWRGGGEGVGKI